MYEVTKEFEFCAAHHLPGHPTCGVMHGHNYRVLVTFESEELDETGMVMDFGTVKKIMKPILKHMDHTVLNTTTPLPNPTAERIAAYLFDCICFRIQSEVLTSCKLPILKSVTVFETPTSSARCFR